MDAHCLKAAYFCLFIVSFLLRFYSETLTWVIEIKWDYSIMKKKTRILTGMAHPVILTEHRIML